MPPDEALTTHTHTRTHDNYRVASTKYTEKNRTTYKIRKINLKYFVIKI